MKVLVIGGVAAGTKTAAKLKRMDRSADVRVISRDRDISYAGCGLPYYVGGMIEQPGDLIVNTPEKCRANRGGSADRKRSRWTGCRSEGGDSKRCDDRGRRNTVL